MYSPIKQNNNVRMGIKKPHVIYGTRIIKPNLGSN